MTSALRLEIAGVDTFLGSTLCACCPLGPLGCCAAPPAFTWADLGRIVGHGGAAWLLDEVRAGRLRPSSRGLSVLRTAPARDEPLRCAYHGPRGCTIAADRRSATCNDYLCEDAIADGAAADAGAAASARSVHERLAALYARWDAELAAMVEQRWPAGPTWDAAFLAELGREHARRVHAGAAELDALEASARSHPNASMP